MTNALLIVGLGNPGSKYEHTRHNIGFRVVDRLRTTAPATDSSVVDTATVKWNATPRQTIFFMKPQDFMNASGTAVVQFVNFYKLPLSNLWVIHDDLDLAFGELKPVFDRGDAGHQGVASIIEQLGSKAFNRLRIGIGSNRPAGMASEDYVLQRFSDDEERVLESTTIPAAVTRFNETIRTFLTNE